MLRALEDGRVNYVLVGTLAAVLRGSPETTDLVEICPQTKPENMDRLDRALQSIGNTTVHRGEASLQPGPDDVRVLDTPYGQLKIEALPAGTTGYDDLRRHAIRELVHERGPRVQVAALGDLVRVLRARDLPEEAPRAQLYRRLLEITREHERSLGISR